MLIGKTGENGQSWYAPSKEGCGSTLQLCPKETYLGLLATHVANGWQWKYSLVSRPLSIGSPTGHPSHVVMPMRRP
jgi:hypothetical protein